MAAVPELWTNDWDWEDPSAETTPPLAEPVEVQYNRSRHIGKTVGNIAISFCVVTLSLAGLGVVAERHKPSDQTPTFSSQKIGDCYVSTEWKWVWPRGGIDDLVIHEVEGVSAEGGPGSECLMAARQVVTNWANNDGNRYNDIDTDSYPIIRSDQQYPVPYFALTKQPG